MISAVLRALLPASASYNARAVHSNRETPLARKLSMMLAEASDRSPAQEPGASSEGQPGGAWAPGQPGVDPTWTSSAKDIVGCALGDSRLWFTLGFGIINEIYYPRVDLPQVRDLGFIVGDGKGFWVEVKRLEAYTLRLLAPAVPAVEIVHKHPRFELVLRVTPDPDRDVLLIDVDLRGDADLAPYVILAPHLGASGFDNMAEVKRVGVRGVLGAHQGPFGLALAAVDEAQCDALGAMSAGYVGFSDGWQDFNKNGALTWRYEAAGPGNVALTGALPRRCTLGLGFGASIQAAATLAISSLAQPFDNALQRQIQQWTQWHAERNEHSLLNPDTSDELTHQFNLSSMVLRVHRDKTYPGTTVASLSVPWGNSRNDRGGYHLIWPRDLVQCALALLGLGARREARNTLRYLIATQKADGSWSQNQWLGGTPYWGGVQLDESAFPILLAAALHERDALEGIQPDAMVARALGFIARTGPSTSQDRWEENAGLNPFTLAVAIGALVAGAPFVPPAASDFVLKLADFWNANLETWMVAKGTPLAHQHGVEGYYVRIAPPEVLSNPDALMGSIQLKNQAQPGETPITSEVGVDFLQLVRFGLRAPDDPWILGSIAVADAALKVDTPFGPVWRRYVGDGYGEHPDGSPFDGSGVGRAWPLLAGERGHYELQAGRDPTPYLRSMAAMTGPGGMMPEQVWDQAPVGPRLALGKPSGSAMPLAWAHAEFIKLMISQQICGPIDRPEALWRRYAGRAPTHASTVWCVHAPIASMPATAGLIVAAPDPFQLRWGVDGWRDVADTPSIDTGLGVHVVELAADALGAAAEIDFTFNWTRDQRWEGRDFKISRR
jgi:glucoamylase